MRQCFVQALAILCIFCGLRGTIEVCQAESPKFTISKQTANETIEALIKTHGDSHADRIEKGVNRAASLWWADDGNEADFTSYCIKQFIANGEALRAATKKVDKGLEIIRGHLHRINRNIRLPLTRSDLEPTAVDHLLVRSIPQTDFFESKLAFFIAINFSHYSLEHMLDQGSQWSHQQWAAARIGEMFPGRLPADIEKKAAKFSREKETYFQNYFIHMDRVLTPEKTILFSAGLKLGCHHGLRDNLKGQYTKAEGLVRQELIYAVMLRIIDQTIPKQVIDNHDVFWEPQSNSVYTKEKGKYVSVEVEPETNLRYQVLLNAFKINRMKDPYYPSASTYIQRTFNQRQMSEESVESIILSILDCPETAQVAELISKRLGRPLRPFDIWYNGFQAQSGWSEDELDDLVRKRYPDPASFQADIPTFLRRLGFSKEKAHFLGEHVVVDPVHIGGHADGAAMRGDKSCLRTVFTPEGLDYKGFRISIHELGHTIHQNLARYGSDYYVLGDMPMSGFSEAIAELFAYRNMKALGLEDQTDPNERSLQALASFWYVYEHAGHALTEMRTWHWLYAHPDADADELKEAVQEIACSVWNDYYAPIFGVKDTPILSIYSHFINGSLYLHSYVLGNVIMYQLYDFMEGKDFSKELERMCRQGRLTPDLWMQKAVGSCVSTAPMLRDVRKALRLMK